MKCPECQLEIPEDSKFCKECGHPLVNIPDTYKTSRRINSERKHVTIMFSDLSGYTAMNERLDPEDVKEIMNRIFGEITRIIHNYGGFIERFIGDAVMAVFGVPKVHEDDPIRAIWAAKEIHAFVNRFSPQIEKRIGEPLRMHTGINSGLVVTDEVDIAKGTHGLTGDAINLASRLEGLANAGEIIVGPSTYRRSEGIFSFRPRRPTKVKGKADPIQSYKVLSPKTHAKKPRIGLERRIYSKMIGRDKELNKLELQLAKAIDGDGSVVNIVGEAGIGKSRLFAEFKHLDALKRVMLLEGKALSIGRNLAFHPIIDLLKHWARIGENDSEAAALSKLESSVQDVCREDADEIIPFLATLMGMKLLGRYAERIAGIEGEALEKLILKNVSDLLSKAAERIPLVIMMEDLRWADTSSIKLLESLFRLAETQSILFVNLFRPDHQETGERIVKTLKGKLAVYHVEIELKSLDESISARLISDMLHIQDLDYSIKNKIIKRTGGNPFFIEEIVRSFVDEGVIVPKNGKFEINDKIAEIVVPHTIKDVLNARIDHLEKETRDLVKIASVIGKNFFYRILTNVATAIKDVDSHLDYLKKIQMIMERMRLDELEFLFKHALVQEAAYNSLLHGKRKALHLRVANTIESLFKERLHEFYGMLALHYKRAQNDERAEYYLAMAGEDALKSSASSEALHYYQEALKLYLKKSGTTTDPEKEAMLEKNIALALYNRGQHDEAVEHFDRALEYYWGELPQNAVSRLFKVFSTFLHLITALFIPSLKFKKTPTQRDLRVFNLFYKKCKALVITNPKRSFYEFLFLHKTITAFDLMEIENGTRIFVSASPLFSFSGISFRLSRRLLDFVKFKISKDDVRTYTTYALCETVHNFLVGNWKETGDYDVDLINRNCDIGELYDATQMLYWHAFPCIYQGSLEIAESILNRLEEIFQVYQYNLAKTYEYELKSCLFMGCRKFNDALIVIREGIDFEEKAGPGFWELYVYEARIYTSLGKIEKAKKSLERANRICHQIRPVPFQMSGLLIAELEYNLQRLKEMLRNGHKTKLSEHRKKVSNSVKQLLRNTQKVAQYRTDAFKLAGEFHWLMNKPKKALACWHKAIEAGERIGARLQLAGVYFELGKRLLEPGNKHSGLNGIRGEDYLEKARSLLVDIKLPSYLDELNQVTGG